LCGVVLGSLAGAFAVTLGLLPSSMPLDLVRLVSDLGAAPPPVAKTDPVPPVPVTVARVQTEDVPIFLGGIGTVQAYNTVAVKTRVDGEIVKVLFTEGQDVKAGDPLAIIDPRPYQAQLAQQQAQRLKDQANLQGAMLDLARYAELAKKNFASRQQLEDQQATADADRAQVAADEAQIGYAQTQLDYTTIRSPLDGRVGIRQVDQGNIVHAADNTALVVITQLQPISVVFTLAAASVAQTRLTLGQAHVPVVAFAADNTTVLDRGSVDLVDNQVDQTTGTIKLKASFPNAALRLWPGDFVNGRIIVDTQHAAPVIPEAALRHGPRNDFVWLVHADNTATTRAVVPGQAADGKVLIEKGLKPGDQVVTDGWYRLVEKSPVEIIRHEAKPEGQAANATPGGG
jgi:membrane fusion protein, multidrug efflux system